MKKQIYPLLVVLLVIFFVLLYKMTENNNYKHDTIYGYTVGSMINNVPYNVSLEEVAKDFKVIRKRLNIENIDYAENSTTTKELKYIKVTNIKDVTFGDINYLYLTTSDNRIEGITAEIQVNDESKCVNVITRYIDESSKNKAFKAGKIDYKKVEIDGKINSITHAGSSWIKDGFESISGLYCSKVGDDVKLYVEFARVPDDE